ncbi:MAG: PhoH family protein [Candidatus Hydrogenedentota bacterium]
MTKERRIIELPSLEHLLAVLGTADTNLKIIRKNFENVKIIPRGNRIIIEGTISAIDEVSNIFSILSERFARGNVILEDDVKLLIEELKKGHSLLRDNQYALFVSRQGKVVRPLTAGQREYVEAMKKNDIIFVIGPAGTGKTYLAVAYALSLLNKGIIRRIILTRPAVEAGEKLGFLPGDLVEKVNPYLRPLYDALYDMLETFDFEKMFQHNVLEIAPLAFMRGRTLNDALVILDEAQNTTYLQMKMFLTRLGLRSKAIITGDITQIDLPKGEKSGLIIAEEILHSIEGIAFIRVSKRDVVRHKLVQHIIDAYEKYSISLKDKTPGLQKK